MTFEGHKIIVPPGVLDPLLFRSGAWLAREVASVARPEMSVLDIGCGTGVVGLLAQSRGASVIATDRDPAACAAARQNGLKDVRRGDLFEAVSHESFDLIAFNPPYWAGRPAQHRLGHALYGGDDLGVLRTFARGVREHLLPNGQVWVALSDRAPGSAAALGAGWQRRQETTIHDESFAIWCLEAKVR